MNFRIAINSWIRSEVDFSFTKHLLLLGDWFWSISKNWSDYLSGVGLLSAISCFYKHLHRANWWKLRLTSY